MQIQTALKYHVCASFNTRHIFWHQEHSHQAGKDMKCYKMLSELASLVLNIMEINTPGTYYKGCLEGLMKLYMKTPAWGVYFLAGSLPASALMDLFMFSLFSMMLRQPTGQAGTPLSHLPQILLYLLKKFKEMYCLLPFCSQSRPTTFPHTAGLPQSAGGEGHGASDVDRPSCRQAVHWSRLAWSYILTRDNWQSILNTLFYLWPEHLATVFTFADVTKYGRYYK